MRRRNQAPFDAGLGLGTVEVAHRPLPLDVCQFKVVDAVLNFLLAVNVPVRVHAVEIYRPDLAAPLQVHDDPLQPVGDLHAHRVQTDPARLLEVGELRDLLAVQPDLPA